MAKADSKPRTSPLPVRLPEGMKEQLDAAASKVGLTRNALIVKSLERTLGIARVDAELPAESHVCLHPKDREDKVMSGKTIMLVRCGECGLRLR